MMPPGKPIWRLGIVLLGLSSVSTLAMMRSRAICQKCMALLKIFKPYYLLITI